MENWPFKIWGWDVVYLQSCAVEVFWNGFIDFIWSQSCFSCFFSSLFSSLVQVLSRVILSAVWISDGGRVQLWVSRVVWLCFVSLQNLYECCLIILGVLQICTARTFYSRPTTWVTCHSSEWIEMPLFQKVQFVMQTTFNNPELNYLQLKYSHFLHF